MPGYIFTEQREWNWYDLQILFRLIISVLHAFLHFKLVVMSLCELRSLNVSIRFHLECIIIKSFVWQKKS